MLQQALGCGLILVLLVGPVLGQRKPMAVCKKAGPTNEITSALLSGNPPLGLGPLNIIRRGTLAKSFSVYTDSENGKIDDNGRTLSRTIRRWNGKLYR